MTYPYSQPGGQQDPWGQQTGYPQAPYGQQWYPQPGGFPPPPNKSNTGVLVTIIAVVVIALGALGITGFVAPGFFLSDEDENDAGDPGGVQSNPRTLAEELVTRMNAEDANALTALMCQDAGPHVRSTAGQLGEIESVRPTGQVHQVDDTTATAEWSVTAAGMQATVTATMSKQGQTWCWKSVREADRVGETTSVPEVQEPESAPQSVPEPESVPAPDRGGDTGVPGGPEVVAEQLIDKVEDGDQSGAERLLCAEAPESTRRFIERAIAGNATDIEMSTTPNGRGYASAPITGTQDGRDAKGLIGMKSFDEGATWCVQLFSIA